MVQVFFPIYVFIYCSAETTDDRNRNDVIPQKPVEKTKKQNILQVNEYAFASDAIASGDKITAR